MRVTVSTNNHPKLNQSCPGVIIIGPELRQHKPSICYSGHIASPWWYFQLWQPDKENWFNTYPAKLFYLYFQLLEVVSRYHDPRGTGMIASSSALRPHPGRVIRDLFLQLHVVWHGMEASLQQWSKGSCTLLVSGHNLRADCQWCTLVSPLNCGANTALASVLALV